MDDRNEGLRWKEKISLCMRLKETERESGGHYQKKSTKWVGQTKIERGINWERQRE